MSEAESEFPDGLRVLAVDDDPVCLKLLVALLQKCRYKVTATGKATEALEILRQSPDSIDIVITDVCMDEIDGFALLAMIGYEMDLPVIMVSGSNNPETVMTSIVKGACDFLVKPVRIEELQNIWQHVYRKSLRSHKPQTPATGQANLITNIISPLKRNATELDKGKEAEENGGSEEVEASGEYCGVSGSPKKKLRVRWDVELHGKFVEAVNRLGGADRAVPNKILREMNVAGVTRESVASHLQKYRDGLKKQREAHIAIDERKMITFDPNRSSGLMMSNTKLPQLINHDPMDHNLCSSSSRSANSVLDPLAFLYIPHKIYSFSGSGAGCVSGSNSSSAVLGVGGCDGGFGGHAGITRGVGSTFEVLPSADFGVNNTFLNFNGATFAALEDPPSGAGIGDIFLPGLNDEAKYLSDSSYSYNTASMFN